MTTPITFRCPDDLLSEIDAFGQEHFPANNASRCDRSKTITAILASGLNSLSDTTQSSDTDKIQVLQQVLQDAISQEVRVSVRQELTEVRQLLDQRMDILEQQQKGSNQELVSSKLELVCQYLGKIERAISSVGRFAPLPPLASDPGVQDILTQIEDKH
jgi:hypothetical protein